MQLLKCIPNDFFPALDEETRNALYVKSEVLSNKYDISIVDITNGLVNLSNNQTVTYEDLMSIPNEDLILNNPEVPLFARDPYISNVEDNFYAERKNGIMDILRGLGLNLNEDEVFEDLPLKYITDMLNIPDDIERNNRLGIYNAIIDENNLTLGDYYDILQEYKNVPDLGLNIDSIKSFEDYYYLNNYIPNNNYKYLLQNIKQLGKAYYNSFKQGIANRSLEILLINLKKLTGVDYKFVNTNSFKARIKYGIVEIGNDISKKDLFHEYLHPFILALQAENPELYDTLVQSPDVQNLANYLRNTEVYSDYAEEEALVRVLSDKYSSNIFRDFYNWLSMLLKRVLGINNKVNLKELSANTSMQDIIDIMTSNKIIDINSEYYKYQERYNIKTTHTFAQISVVNKINNLPNYTLIYQDTDSNDSNKVTYSFTEDKNNGNQKSFYIKNDNLSDVQKLLKAGKYNDIEPYLYKRATNFIEDKSTSAPTIYTDTQINVGKSSSEVGTLYHKLAELFNNYINSRQNNNGFTDNNDIDSNKEWDNIKNVLLRKFKTYGFTKLYTTPFKYEIEEDSKTTYYTFDGYNDKDLADLDKMYDLLSTEYVDTNKNKNILNKLISISDLKDKYDDFKKTFINNGVINDTAFDNYVEKQLELAEQVDNVKEAIDIEEKVKLYQIMYLLYSDKNITEDAANNIFRTYAQYLSPVTVKVMYNNPQYKGYAYPILASVTNVDVTNAYKINSEFYNTLVEFIQSHDRLPYYDTKNYMVYADTVLESFRDIYRDIYQHYGEDCIIMNEKTVGFEKDDVKVVGTIDSIVVGIKNGEVVLGILDYKTIGKGLFRVLTDNKESTEKELTSAVIKEYGKKQYLYQELLANLLDKDISEITNGLYLIKLDRKFEYDYDSILEYLDKDEIKEIGKHKNPTYKKLIEEIGKIDITILPKYAKYLQNIKSYEIGRAIYILEKYKEDGVELNPTDKYDNAVIATIAAINRVMLNRRYEAIETEMKKVDYQYLPINEKRNKATEVVDDNIGVSPTKSVISKPDKGGMKFVPIYFDSSQVVGNFNEEYRRKYETYRSLINYYLHHLHTLKQDNSFNNDDNKYIKKAVESAIVKLDTFIKVLNAKSATLSVDNLESILNLVFNSTNHHAIMKLLHNLGQSGESSNSDINKRQVFTRQTYSFHKEIEDMIRDTRISTNTISAEIAEIEKEQKILLAKINKLKSSAKIISIKNNVIVYDNPELNKANDRYGSNTYKVRQLVNKRNGYVASMNDMNKMSSLLLVLYDSATKDFNLEKLFIEVSYMHDILETYINDMNKDIDINNIDEDLSIKVAKFSTIEKIINVYGSFSSMLNTLEDEVIVNSKKVKVDDSVKKLGNNLIEDLKEIDIDLYNRINALTNRINYDLRQAANKAAKNHIANVISVFNNSDIVSKSSLKDLEITAERFMETYNELKKDFQNNKNLMPDFLKAYYSVIARDIDDTDKTIIEDLLNNLNDTTSEIDYNDIVSNINNIRDKYYKLKVQRYLKNRNNANAEEFIRLTKELDKNSIVFTDAIFKKVNETFLGASKSSYRVVQLLSIINTEIEDNYVSLYSRMIRELENNTATAKLDDSSEGILKMLSNKRLTLKEGLLNFNPFIANTIDTTINEDYLTANYKEIFDKDDLLAVNKMSDIEIKTYIVSKKLVDKYKVLQTNTLISRGKWNLFERFINLRGGLVHLNSKETEQSLANNGSNKDTFPTFHNNQKKPVIIAYMNEIDKTYYHFDYRYYYLKDYLEDLALHYKADDAYSIHFINKLKRDLGLNIDDDNINIHTIKNHITSAQFDRYRQEEIDKLKQHYSYEMSRDADFVDDILLEIEMKYDNYKNKISGIENNSRNLADLTRRNYIEMYCKTNNITYHINDKNQFVLDSLLPAHQSRVEVVTKKADELYNKQILNFYKTYSPFSYSEQRYLSNESDTIKNQLFSSIHKAHEFYKLSNLYGANIVYLPKVTKNKENLDERFDKLLESTNQEHYKYYKYLKHVVSKLHDYIPYDKRNSSNPLDLPAVNDSLWDMMSKIHNIKDFKSIDHKDLIQLVKDNITSHIPTNYEEPNMNVNTVSSSYLGDYKEYRKNIKNLSTQLDKTIQLFMFEALVHKSRIELLPINKMILNLTKDTDNTMLKESANYAYIQNITSSGIRDINSKKDKNPVLTDKDREEKELYDEAIKNLRIEIKGIDKDIENIKNILGWRNDPDKVIKYYELKGKQDNLYKRIVNYEHKIKAIYNRSYVDAVSIERNINSIVKLTGLSYNLTGQVNNLLMGFIQTKNRASGTNEEYLAYEKAFGIMNNIMKPEMLMTMAGISANEIVSGMLPIPVIGHFAGFVAQMLVMSKVGTTLEKRAAGANVTAKKLFGKDVDMLKNFVLTPDLVKFINMNINYNFTNDITEEGKTGKTRRRLTLNEKGQALDTKNQLVNLLKPFTYIQRAELFIAMYSMIIQAELEKITINGEKISFADIHDTDGEILDKYKPYVSDVVINQFRRKTLNRMFEASGNYREIPQIEKYTGGKSVIMYMKWAFEPLHHMFHSMTDKADNVFIGQSEATVGTITSGFHQVLNTSYFKLLKSATLMEKTLSDSIFIDVNQVDMSTNNISSTDPNKIVNFINKFATNLHSNLNTRIVLYKKGTIVTDDVLINEFIKERQSVIDNDSITNDTDRQKELEIIKNKLKYKDIRLLKEVSVQEKNDSVMKILKLAGEMLLPTNHIPKKYSYLNGKLNNKNIGDILRKYVDKPTDKMDEYERAYHKSLRELLSNIHVSISWAYYAIIQKIIMGLILGLFDLDDEDEVYQIIQSFDNKFNKLYQDVQFLNSPNLISRFIYVPYKLKESLFSPLTFYNNRVVPIFYDVAALAPYAASELITTDDGTAEKIFENIYKTGGLKHPYVDDAKGQFSNWRIINDASKTVPVINRLSAWERDEMLPQQQN